MPLASGQKIIITSADGTKRRRLPSAQITGAKARVERYGGYGQFSVDTAIPFSGDALSTILKGDRVEMYYGGVLRYRGWIEERMRVEGEPDTLGFVGYGLSFLLGQQLCYGRYAYAGNGADLATVFAEVVRDATQSRNQTLPPAMGWQGLALYDALQVLQVGVPTTFVDAYHKLLGDVANDLVQQSGNLCIWGGDVDTFGQNRAYFRPLAPITGMPTHVIPVPARRTQTAQAEDQAGDVKNRTLMTGGQPRFPQLLHNGGFDLPAAFQTGDSGLITDGDFEQKSWSLSSGAAYKDAGHQEGQPFSGNWMVELDHVGEACDKNGSFATTPVAGHSYVFSVRAKKEVGLQTADGSGTLVLKDALNNLLLTVPLTVAPAGTAWDYFSAMFAMPANAAHWYTHFQCDHVASYNADSGGLLLDAVSLEDGSVIYQDGYQTAIYGTAQFLAVNWGYKDKAFDGLYCVYVNVNAQAVNGQDAHLEPLGRARISIQFKQTLRMSMRYSSPVVQTAGRSLPAMQLHLDWYRSDGSYIGNSGVDIAAQAASSAWQYAELVASPPSDAVSVVPTVIFRSNGEVLIDCVSVQDAQAVAAGDVPLMPDGHPGFLPEGDLSTFLTASASGLGGDYASSETAYGSRVDITNQGAVNTLPGLTTVAKARLGVKALALTRPGIARMEDATVYWPGDSMGLQGKHGGQLSLGQILTIAAVDLTFGDLFVANLEVGKEAPDETLAVKSLIQEQLQKNGPGVAAGAGRTGGGYTNSTNFGGAGGGGATTPVTLQTITESDTDPTTHDLVRTGPHVSDTERASWTGTATEVTNAHVSAAKSTAYSNIKTRFEAIETAEVPAGTADGQVPHYTLAGGFVTDASIVVTGPKDIQVGDLAIGGDKAAFIGLDGPYPNGTGTGGLFFVYNDYVTYFGPYNDRNGQANGEVVQFRYGRNNDNTGAKSIVIDGRSQTWTSTALAFSVGSMQAQAYKAADGSAGITGTGGGGDTLKNGLVVGLGNEATLRANAVAAEAAARANGDAASAQKAANLSDLASAATARTNLGLGTAAVANVPAAGSNATAAQVVLGSDTRLGAGAGLVVQSADGTFSQAGVTQLILPNGTLTLVSAGVVKYTPVVLVGKQVYTGLKTASSQYANLVYCWLLAEGTGTANELKTAATATLSAGTSWSTGDEGPILRASASGAFAQTNVSAFNTPAGSIVWRMRPQFAYNDNTQHYFWYQPLPFTNGQLVCEKFSDNQWYCGFYNGGSFGLVVPASAANLPQGAWNIYTLTWSGAGTKLYINNTLIGSNATAANVTASTSNMCLLGSSIGGNPATDLDWWRFYNAELTTTQIAAIISNMNDLYQ